MNQDAFAFPLFGFRVHVGWSALLVLAFLGFSGGGGATPLDQLIAGLMFGGAVFVSILVHELGHGFMGRRLGLAPRHIHVGGFGGFVRYGRRPLPREALWATGAGPGAGLLLGAISTGLWIGLGSSLPPLLSGLLWQLMYINIFWSLFNLLPMAPLDGGTLAHSVLEIRLGRARATQITRKLSIGVAGGVVALGLLAGQFFVAAVGGYVLFQQLQRGANSAG